jgi:hypothetical protein
LGYLGAWPLIAYWPILTKQMLSKSGIVFKNKDEFALLKREIRHGSIRVVLDELKKPAKL